MPLVVDENIHYRVLKLMYGSATRSFDVALWLGSLPILYGVWHPYKYCLMAVYRMFFPIFALLEVTTAEAGREIRGHRKILHMEKMVAALLLVRHKVSDRAQSYIANTGGLAHLFNLTKPFLECPPDSAFHSDIYQYGW